MRFDCLKVNSGGDVPNKLRLESSDINKELVSSYS